MVGDKFVEFADTVNRTYHSSFPWRLSFDSGRPAVKVKTPSASAKEAAFEEAQPLPDEHGLGG